MSRTLPLTDPVECWVFDLDNTLYPASSNLFGQVDWRMTDYIAQLLGLSRPQARGLQKTLFRQYGTTLRGLMTEYGVDPHEFMEFVHDIDLSPVPPAPVLDAVLARLPGRKLIYTNGSVAHADRVTERLGVGRHFDAVFDIAAADFVPKPNAEPYRTLIACHGIDPRRTVMIEDIARNLEPAAALGMTTVLVRTDKDWATAGADQDWVHYQTDDLVGWLEQAVPERAEAIDRAAAGAWTRIGDSTPG